MLDEPERTDELDKISKELLERAVEELETWAELLETSSLELLSLTLEELLSACEELDGATLELETLLDDIALLELFLVEELLGFSELEEI